MSLGANIRLPFEQVANDVIAGDEKLVNFKYFFTRKLAFLKETHAVINFPGGFGTHDEGFEALTLIQTGKGRRIPLVLVDSSFWRGLLDWLRDTLVAQGKIDAKDIDLMRVVDDDAAVLDVIFDFYEKRGFASTPKEREQLLYL
jgi:uncharacterized protein (TIGR00730 family)